MENKSYDDVVGSAAAPFTNRLAKACGLAANYHALAHPSLPNYIGATSGATDGIVDDGPPVAHPLRVPSIYSQVDAAGKTWREYEESAPARCPLASSGRDAVKHDPAPYYRGVRRECSLRDVPLGTTAHGSLRTDLAHGTLPAFSLVTPNLCDDTHDCGVATGDAWLQSWFARILSSPNYRTGDTVVFLTWDEDGSASNRVPMIVVSPSTAPGTVSTASFDHYSLLRTTEQLLGIHRLLGHAGDRGTASMAGAFRLR
jgi:phosphatidylinositol-3-phosphatase